MTELPIRVLIVDDEPQIRRFLRTSLSAHGYRVTEASCGREALSLMTTERPELVLLDLGLPDMAGAQSDSDNLPG
jgi:two-component system, OmpR family, KDP operon response regulator KdpE